MMHSGNIHFESLECIYRLIIHCNKKYCKIEDDQKTLKRVRKADRESSMHFDLATGQEEVHSVIFHTVRSVQ